MSPYVRLQDGDRLSLEREFLLHALRQQRGLVLMHSSRLELLEATRNQDSRRISFSNVCRPRIVRHLQQDALNQGDAELNHTTAIAPTGGTPGAGAAEVEVSPRAGMD